MLQANISTLKNHLSRFIEQIQSGEHVIISDRKRPVAILSPYSGRHADGKWTARFSELERKGQIALPVAPNKKVDEIVPVKCKAPVHLSAAVIQERREGR